MENFRISLTTFQEDNQNATIDILDQAGKVVATFIETTKSGLLEKQISVSKLTTGFYFVRVLIYGKFYIAKLILQ